MSADRGSTLKASQYELSLLVNNKPLPEYYHEGNVFVEGRSGSEYKIRIKNNTGSRTCFIVSVDGLSVLNGEKSSSESPGYVLNPWGSLEIACYKVDDATGAKFVFGEKDKSYSVTIGEGGDNVGVIGAIVFKEKAKIIHRPPPFREPRRWDDDSAWPSRRYGKIVASAAAASIQSMKRSYIPTATTYSTNSTGPLEQQSVSDEPLGTSFGESMEWKTSSVTFEREAAPQVRMDIFYDTRKNLERRGVKLEHKVPPLPNAFPADQGCKTPPGWQK